MASARFEFFGTTPHRHESEGLEWLASALPNYEPYGGIARPEQWERTEKAVRLLRRCQIDGKPSVPPMKLVGEGAGVTVQHEETCRGAMTRVNVPA